MKSLMILCSPLKIQQLAPQADITAIGQEILIPSTGVKMYRQTAGQRTCRWLVTGYAADGSDVDRTMELLGQ